MSAINTIVGISKAADKWLKLESLQIATLQLFIIGKISFRFKLSRAVHCLLNLDPQKKYTKEEVITSYKKIMKKIHPDVSPELSRLASIVNEAKEVVLKSIS